jgi:hypothetical protein
LPKGQKKSNIDFNQVLSEYLQKLNEYRRRGASEDSIRDLFLQFLRTAFPRIEQGEIIELERHVSGLHVRGGFIDFLYGDLIFEFKRKLDASSHDEGIRQLYHYISGQKNAGKYFGILSDGESFEIYLKDDTTLKKIDSKSLKLEESENVKLWFDCYLFHEKNMTPTANDVVFRFGELSPSFCQIERNLNELWKIVSDKPDVKTKFSEWQSLLSIVYGSKIGDTSLFIRHTYLAFFARIIAYATLQKKPPDLKEMNGVISGSVFSTMGFNNFAGEDFFTWLGDDLIKKEAKSLLTALATRLATAYNLTEIYEDLLKELYQELVEPQTRHGLGEFYTPDWLAELTLREAGFPRKNVRKCPSDSSILDPACGSGTFLFIAVHLLREKGLKGSELVDFCTQNLAGLDIHPVANIFAKTNLLLALGDDISDYGKQLNIPVYIANTINITQQNIGAIRVKIDTEEIKRVVKKPAVTQLPDEFYLTSELTEKPDALYDVIDALITFGDSEIKDSDAREGFLVTLEKLGLKEAKHLWISNLKLMRWLLHPPVTNTVWRFILNNAFQPEILAKRKFSFVVGNPPWLVYRDIKRLDYQEHVRALTFEYGLLGKKEAKLFTQMELATLFFAFSDDRFLADGGKLAFVMPRSVLTGAKQHVKFQNTFVLSADKIIDCEKVSPLFKIPSCVIIREKGGKPLVDEDIPVIELAAELPGKNVKYSEAQSHLRINNEQFGKALDLLPENRASMSFGFRV